MLRKIVSLLPASIIRFAGRLQFKFPLLKLLINYIGHMATGEGIIQRGVAKGLRFNAINCNPGFLTGTSEPEEQELLASLLNHGDVLYDIGANAGFYVVMGAHLVSTKGHVYAFEPTPELVDRIRYNVTINNFNNVSVVEVAVCGHDGTVRFGCEGFNISNSIASANMTTSIEADAIRLDTWVTKANVLPPNVILMDIEGAEIDALEGALNLLREHRPTLMVEVHWLGQRFLDFVEQEIKPLGYSAQTYSNEPLPREGRYHALLRPISK